MAGAFLSMLSLLPAHARYFSREALKADVDTLYRTLQEVHPDLFAVAGRARLDSIVQSIHCRLDQAESHTGSYFHAYLLPLFAAIGDGHTSLMPLSLDKQTPILPFEVEILDDSTLRVQRHWQQDCPIAIGARIDSINGESARELIRRFLVWVPGERMHFRLAALEDDFPIYYACWNFGCRTFRIQATTPDGTVVRDTLDAVPYRFKWLATASLKPYSLKILSDTVALLELRSLADDERFHPFLDSAFRTLRDRRIPNLIVDLRANGGGSTSNGEMLLRYISRQPFVQIERGTIKNSRQSVEKSMARYRSYYPKRYTDEMILQKENRKYPWGTVTYDRNPKSAWQKPYRAKDRYSGKVWMLTSHYTYSSAANLSWAFRYFDMGTIVGEETGGMSVAFGSKYIFQLPNTGLLYGVSSRKLYEIGATDEDIHGTLPDCEVPADEALDYTLKLIRQGGRR